MPDSDDYDFHIVRCLCSTCGWFRIVGLSGVKGPEKALIRLHRDKSGCNLVKAEVLIGPRWFSADQIADGREGLHDLKEEAYDLGLFKAQRQYDYLFEGRVCPRCKRPEKLGLDWFRYYRCEFDFDRYKCWRLEWA